MAAARSVGGDVGPPVAVVIAGDGKVAAVAEVDVLHPPDVPGPLLMRPTVLGREDRDVDLAVAVVVRRGGDVGEIFTRVSVAEAADPPDVPPAGPRAEDSQLDLPIALVVARQRDVAGVSERNRTPT